MLEKQKNKMEEVIDYKEQWNPGEIAWFEYHCWESPDSSDAELWYHSHQQVTIIEENPNTDAFTGEFGTFLERAEGCVPKVYKIHFSDGFEYEAFEDELYTNSAGFEREDPPEKEEMRV